MAASEARFIEDIARLLLPWGVPSTAARLYGYLLLSAEPADLDRIARDLEIGKSSASVAARLLEKYMLVRRLGVRGSKRVLYEVSDNYVDMLAEQNRLLQALADVLRAGTRVTRSRATRDRLAEMADFYLVVRQGMDATFDRWRAKKR
ncbi:hypothetical protein [Bradyrhizobium sp. LHD-71]|uniref:GbsR/MarR family transcriptional regulator n=1 Tax=Bradyrhizobium sp. LHD-71 TaxID=3072141 RepID=UPI00280FD25D|nr:hypothetical protein [Bradyrhizobium sp. LHD-71]MDQ8730207.1 hypothetical protein [Bradyrhizobium sp. LHD-71]